LYGTGVDRSVRLTKRVIDLVGSSLGLAITLPLYPLIAAAIYLESPGPVFIRQKRAGRLVQSHDETRPGIARPIFREFLMLKFRSMVPDAEKYTGPVLATEKDPRITRVGQILRRTRLDEIPQFINVIRGEMSLVGPRPERPELAQNLALAIPYFEERMRDIKPGITGLAQISLRYTGKLPPGSILEPFAKDLTNPFKVDGAEEALADDMRMKLLYDLAYSAATESMRNFLPLEVSILVKTPLVMIKAVGT
jgi:lipopolysaccharide/colanic/teichoic acid biosynthesis glycosyltransferase